MTEKGQKTFTDNSRETYKDMKIYLISHKGKTENKTILGYLFSYIRLARIKNMATYFVGGDVEKQSLCYSWDAI